MANATFDAIKIGIASPDMIRKWSFGEVKKPETINYRTLKPERDGLYCERIFGPNKDWECHCGKYKKIKYKGKVCDRCGVEVTKAKVRRERMGHIELAAPCSHIWYFKGIPSRIGLVLEMSPKNLEKILYFASYVVTDPGTTPLTLGQSLTEKEYREYREKYEDDFQAGMGAEAVKLLLATVGLEGEDRSRKISLMNRYDELMQRKFDLEENGREIPESIPEELADLQAKMDELNGLDALAEQLRTKLQSATAQQKLRIVKRLEVVEAFRQSGNQPSWMIMDVLPVIPPDIRPMVQLDGGRFATSDLNDLYRRVINRNNRLKRLKQLGAPEIIIRNEKRMLQEAVDALIDNGRRGRAVTGANNRALKSLSDMLKGKQGRFRQNLLGKRVDYSGRSVIVVGPELKLYQCGVPKEMAIELFRPFVMKKLVADGNASNVKAAKKKIDKGEAVVWDALDEIIKDRPVMLNRAPTLHRLGIQAFEPVLVEGRALKLHPLCCTAFNADFDGDQMAIHVPLSAEAQAEARMLMLSANNLLRPQDGKPVTVPTQDMILGAYYLTYTRLGKVEKGAEEVYVADAGDTGLPVGELVDADDFLAANKRAKAAGLAEATFIPKLAFSSVDEAIAAYASGDVSLHAPIRVRVGKEIDGKMEYRIINATVGRLYYNEPIPQDLGFVDRTDPAHAFDLEVDFLVGKKQLGKIIDNAIRKHGFTVSTEMLDRLKALGYKFSTKGAISVSIADMVVPQKKYDLVHDAEQMVVKIDQLYRQGLITNDERYRLTVQQWEKTTDEVTSALKGNLDQFNPIYMMADSGARGSMAQIRQLAGMRGLMADTTGRTIEIPIKANFREGLSVLEYFISTRGARKGMADTALRTADSGYLTRRMVDVSQEVIIREHDCKTTKGIWVGAVVQNGDVIDSFGNRIRGRYPVNDIYSPKTGELLHSKDVLMMPEDAAKFEKHGIDKVYIRTILGCRARSGVCATCYGMNLATSKEVNLGEAVGIIAAQSIGEPGTQLTMRTFHSGGVAGDDITQGLPRVEELFEARRPKKMAQLAEFSGKVKFDPTQTSGQRKITITAEDGEVKEYFVPFSVGLKVQDGRNVEKGAPICDGALYPQDVLRISGTEAVQDYLVQSVQTVYRQQGVEINDKHIEVIIRQMMRKVKVEDPGDSTLLTGTVVDTFVFEDAEAEVQARIDAGETELRLPTCQPQLLGITKASLATDSFLSAASFQETTKVLTDAAIRGKVDHLVGLKENVIIGKLIPAGSGLMAYRDFEPGETPEPRVTEEEIAAADAIKA
ncbi:MAG: DNA-directed RNA polymerase subunit beta' [Oscillospiraceae bacterium]|nr:DNA-directed RNA polymerase subunit beta' [Oscillospiraceae bacterium]